VAVLEATFPAMSRAEAVMVYTRPRPEPSRSARTWTTPPLTTMSPPALWGSLLVTSMESDSVCQRSMEWSQVRSQQRNTQLQAPRAALAS